MRKFKMEKEKTKPSDLKLISREEVSKILAPTENLTFTDLKPGDDIEVNFHGNKDEPVVTIGNNELRLTPKSLFDSAHCIGLTQKYTTKCPADLLFGNMNYFFGNGMKKPIRAISKDDVLLSMTKDRVKTRTVSNERLLGLAEQRIGLDHIVGYHQTYSDLNNSTVAIVTDHSFEPVNRDTLFGGIKISNSITGQEVIEISPYIFRQWCSNGAITADALGKYTRKKHDNLDNWFNEIIEGANSTLDKEFERIRHLTSISVKGHLSETISGIGKDRRLSGKIIEQVFDQATSENAETMYDVYNAFTWVASHDSDLTPTAVSRLQWIAGAVAKEHEVCTECHRILN